MLTLGSNSGVNSEGGLDFLPPVNRLNNWVGDFFKDSSTRNHFSTFPNISIVSDKDGIVVEAEMPGMKIEDIIVDVKDQVLTISGERKKTINSENDNWSTFYSEIFTGKFKRDLMLPFKIDLKSIKATLNNGLLKLNMLKSEVEKPIRINISSE